MQKLYVFVSDYEQVSNIFKLYPKHQFMWELPSLDNKGKNAYQDGGKDCSLLLGESRVVFKNKMQPTNPNAHTYVNGTDVETHGHEVTQNTFLKQFI